MVEQQASDLLISVGAPPSLKTPKGLMPLGRQPLSSSQVRSLVLNAVPEKQRERFQEEHEANFALSLESAGWCAVLRRPFRPSARLACLAS